MRAHHKIGLFIHRSLFLYIDLFSRVYRSLVMCIQVSFHVYVGLFSCVHRFLCMFIGLCRWNGSLTTRVYTMQQGLFSCFCRPLFTRMQVFFHVYIGLFSCANGHVQMGPFSYIYRSLFMCICRSIFMCIQVSLGGMAV